MKTLILILAAAAAAGAQTRTVTNADLEKFRQERLRAEDDYRRNYARRGMPSPEEAERINAEKRRELEELSARLRSQREASESDLVERANDVRGRLAAVDAQLAYLAGLRGRTFEGAVTYWGFAPRRSGNRYRETNARRDPLPPNLQTVNDISRMFPNSSDIFNRAVGNYAFREQRVGSFGAIGIVPAYVTIGNRNDLELQILLLGGVRAGIAAEWRALEEEARRAGVRLY